MNKSIILYRASVRCKFNYSYYERLFSGFRASLIYVSEFPPQSKRNFGRGELWIPVSYDVAKSYDGDVFYKNASFYGRSCYYIQKNLFNLFDSVDEKDDCWDLPY